MKRSATTYCNDSQTSLVLSESETKFTKVKQARLSLLWNRIITCRTTQPLLYTYRGENPGWLLATYTTESRAVCSSSGVRAESPSKKSPTILSPLETVLDE